jgi:hypothetical protein
MRYLMLLLASLFFLARGPALLGAGKSRAEKARPLAKAGSSAKLDSIRWQETAKVPALGENLKQAEDVALWIARDKVCEYLHEKTPLSDWTPSVAYVKEKLVKESSEQGKDPKSWVVHVVITEGDYQEMLRLDRAVRAQQRMFWLGKILAGIVIALTAVVGYLRLDEWTKGYYTTWLRLGVVSLLGGIGIGLWWIT